MITRAVSRELVEALRCRMAAALPDAQVSAKFDSENPTCAQVLTADTPPMGFYLLARHDRRIEVGGMRPRSDGFDYALKQRDSHAELERVTVSADRDPEEAARDIWGRYWPKYLEAFTEARGRWQDAVDAARRLDLLKERLRATYPRLRPYGEDLEGTFGHWQRTPTTTEQARVRLSAGRTFGLAMDLTYLSTRQVDAVMAALASVPDEIFTFNS